MSQSASKTSVSEEQSVESRFLLEANEKLAQPGDPLLLPGESMQVAAKHVSLVCPYNGVLPGTLFLSTYKMTFTTTESEPQLTYVAPMGAVHTVEKVGGASSKGEFAYGLEVQFKDFRTFRFAFKQEGHSRRLIFETMQRLAYPLSSGRPLFAYEYGVCAVPPSGETSPAAQFDMKAELARIGVPSEEFRLTTLNENYELCASYPPVLAVPASATDDQVKDATAFRSRNRLPAFSWMHAENRSSLFRGSQPQVGKFGKRSKEDEAFLLEIAKANPQTQKLVILDARPKLNAIANKAMGGGYEDEEAYGMDLVFLDIGNIHVMRDSLKKLRDMCHPTIEDTHWLSNLEGTHWLEHVRLVLVGANRIVEYMDGSGVSVFVHCSDGWDRTSQLCALAMMLMDPYYRTIAGFSVLIEKEWLAFGHKFQQRIGHGDKHSGDEQRSPIFVQFIDAVWQITNQYPCAFEFNEHFLLTILDHLFSCLYGTFLCNSEKERAEEVKDKTISLWTDVAKNQEEYMNPLYSSSGYSCVLHPSASMRRLQFWPGYYTRWNPEMRPHKSEHDRSQELYRICLQLKKQCASMQKQLDEKDACTDAPLDP
eukprot:scpid50643/ scgid22187/ Myotubularin-related protein 2